jgi:ribonucleoside-triphosphate reductase
MLIDAEANPELSARYKIKQAPTLVVVKGDEVKKYANASNIKKYAENCALTSV